MKFLVWGTGRNANSFLSLHINEFFFRNLIVAFVDNDKKKQGKYFWGKRIISPAEICEYDIDEIIICCNSEKEIVDQIKLQLKIQVPIRTRNEIMSVMYKYYHDEMKIYDKRILIVGTSINRKTNIDRLFFLKDIEYVNIDQIKDIKRMSYDYVLCTWPSEYTGISTDKRYEVIEKCLIDRLVDIGGVKRENVLTSSVIGIYKSVDKKYSLGEENADKVFFLMKPGSGIVGLGGILLQVIPNILYARKNNMIPVIDMESFKNSYITYDEIGRVNGWEKFFLQPDHWRVEDIKKSKYIVESMAKREYTHEVIVEECFRAQPKLEKAVNEYCHKYFDGDDRILGVLVRGTDYVRMKPYAHCIQPDLSVILETAREKYECGKYDRIYLCTEEQAVVDKFGNEFGDKVFWYSAPRVKDAVDGYLSESAFYSDYDLYSIGANYWIELCALSRCNALVAGDCSGTQIALLLNQNEYEDVYIFKLGKYGIDDIDNNHIEDERP